METTRLSEVITGCGGKGTTCSRMSTLARTRATYGIRMLSPGLRVRWNRPNRSTTSICCCCTTRTDLARVTTTNRIRPIARTMRKIWVPFTSFSPDERSRALDLDDPDLAARVDDLSGVVRARLPVCTVDLDHAPPLGDLLDHRRFRTLDGVQAHHRRLGVAMQSTFDRGSHGQHAERGDPGEDRQLERQRRDEAGGRGGEGTAGQHDQHKIQREQLRESEQHAGDKPDDGHN